MDARGSPPPFTNYSELLQTCSVDSISCETDLCQALPRSQQSTLSPPVSDGDVIGFPTSMPFPSKHPCEPDLCQALPRSQQSALSPPVSNGDVIEFPTSMPFPPNPPCEPSNLIETFSSTQIPSDLYQSSGITPITTDPFDPQYVPDLQSLPAQLAQPVSAISPEHTLQSQFPSQWDLLFLQQWTTA